MKEVARNALAAVRDPRTRASRLAVPVGLVAALTLSVQALPQGLPAGLYGTALVFGAQAALGAVGILLIYRSDRIINFAQIQLGAFGAVLFFQAVQRTQFAKWGELLCGPCFEVRLDRLGRVIAAETWLVWANFVLALTLGLGLAALLGWLVRVLIIRRFRDQPPLIGTVATLGVVQVLAYLTRALPPLIFESRAEREATGGVVGGGLSGTATPPIDVTVHWDPAVFHIGEIATLVVTAVVVVGLGVFLRRSKLGTGMRAASDNRDRAATLGMDPERLSARVWLIAGLLSGIAGVLGAMTAGGGGIGGLSASGMLRLLAAAVIAGMHSIPIAIAVVLAFSVFDQAFLWSFGGGSGALVDVVVFAALLVTLLLRRPQPGRVDPEAAGWRAAEEARPIPARLKVLPFVKKARRAGPISLAVVLLAFPWVMSPNDTHQGSVMLLFAIVGLSLLVLTGWAGQLSLGQFAFAAVGGYVTAIAGGAWGWPLPLAVPLGGIAGAVVALIVGLPALRIRGMYLGVTTLGFAVLTSSVLLSDRFGGRGLPESLKRSPFLGIDLADERIWYYVTLLIVCATVAAVVGLRRSRTARALIACRDNERAAQALGINLTRARLEAFAVSGFLAATAGGLFAYHQEGVAAGNYAVEASLTMFLLAVIGGLGSVAGPLLGALYVGGLTIFASSFAGLGTGLLSLVILLFAPSGLTRIAYGVRDAVLRRVAERSRVTMPGIRADAAGEMADFKTPIAPKLLPTGETAPVPTRYRLPYHRPTLERPGVRRG